MTYPAFNTITITVDGKLAIDRHRRDRAVDRDLHRFEAFDGHRYPFFWPCGSYS